MGSITVRTVRTITTTVRSTYSRKDLIEMLGLPSDAVLTVRVPGGWDWSNTDLEIDADTVLSARTVNTKTEELDD